MRTSGVARAILRQLYEKNSSTYTYIVGCEVTKKCAIIDPVIETVKRDAKLIRELGLDPIFAINTHLHADHVTGTALLKKEFPHIRSCLSEEAGGRADVELTDSQVVDIGELMLEVRSTPGHTNGCLTFVDYHNKCAFTGDALLIRGCGRTDFQDGDPHTLYQSVWEKILSLPDDFTLYVGHNYNGTMTTTVWEEKKWNPRLTLSEHDFAQLMNNLKLDYPKQIDRALPLNTVDGEGAEPLQSEHEEKPQQKH